MLAEDIYKDIMENPASWKQGDCTICKRNLSVWTSGGLFFIKLYRPDNISFPLYWKWKIWRAIQTREQRLSIKGLGT